MSAQRCPHCQKYDDRLDRGYCVHCRQDIPTETIGAPSSPAPQAAASLAPFVPRSKTRPASAARFRATAVGINLIRTGFCIAVPATVFLRLGDWPLAVPRFVLRLGDWRASVPLIFSSLFILGGLFCCCWSPSWRTRFSALFLLLFIPGLGALYALFPETMTAYRAAECLLSLVPLAGFGFLAGSVISCTPPDDPVRKKFEKRVSILAICYGLSCLFAVEDDPKKMDFIGPIVRQTLGVAAEVAAFIPFVLMLGIACDMSCLLADPGSDYRAGRRAIGAREEGITGAAKPSRRPILGVVLMALGWPLFILASVVMPFAAGPLMAGAAGTLGMAIVLIVCLCWWAGGRCVVLGRRMRARRADVALAQDPRPPILYLRPFRFDGTLTHQERPWKMKSTYEEHLAQALGKFGPFVAIGQPGEGLPELGADRLYVDGDRWQQEVRGLMARAAAVILTAGDSWGLQWELHEAVATVRPERLLIFLPLGPSPTGTEDDRQEAYDDRQDAYDGFRRWARHVLPKGLPEEVGDAHFIYFTDDWTPWLLLPPEVPLLLGIRRLRVEILNKTLQPLLECLQQDQLFLRPLRLGRIVLLAVCVPIVLIVFYLVLIKDVSFFVAMPVVTLLILGILVGIMAVLKKL
jgi:hypothetical protein